MRSSGNRAGVQRREANTKKAIKVRCRTALLAAVAAFCAAADAAEFSKAGYWEAEGSPRRVETLTTGWEFSLDGFKTSKTVTLPHGIDEGELGFEASGCVNRQQPAWYRRRFTWKSGGARQFLHFEAIMGKSRVTLNGKQVAEHFGGIYRDAYLIETGEAYVSDTDKGGVRITSNLGADGKWTVRADVTLSGDVDGATATISYDGRAASPLAAESGAVTTTFHPDSPALWTPETPEAHHRPRRDCPQGQVRTRRR